MVRNFNEVTLNAGRGTVVATGTAETVVVEALLGATVTAAFALIEVKVVVEAPPTTVDIDAGGIVVIGTGVRVALGTVTIAAPVAPESIISIFD